MEKMNDLRDLLKHELMDLYSVEEQIIKAMPAMIQKAKNPELKQALQQHLKVTESQRTRLDQVQKAMGKENDAAGNKADEGLLSRLFKRTYTCRGMQGIIEEGEKIMAEDMSPEVMDAAIIAASQKIEHYEICGYGTARAFAEELGLTEVATLLQQTLDEEYEADDRLTALAVNRLNERAEKSGRGSSSSTSAAGKTREGSRQRATRQEPEMEMASAKRGSSARQTAGKAGGTQSSGNTRSTASSSRSSSTTSVSAARKTATKGTGTRGSQSSGRGAASGRGNS